MIKLSPVKEKLLIVVILFVIGRIMIFFLGAVTDFIIPDYNPQKFMNLEINNSLGKNEINVYNINLNTSSAGYALDLKRWIKLDSNWYISLTNYGYTKAKLIDVHPPANWPFFPLYPLVLKGSQLFVMHKISIYTLGIILSNIMMMIGIIYFYLFTSKKFDEDISFLACILLLFFPTSFYYSIIYTESLFFMLFSMGIYYTLKKNWPATIFIASMLAITRPVGVFFTIIPLWEFYKNMNYDFKKLFNNLNTYAFLAIPVPLLIFLTYMQRMTGSWLSPLVEQKNWGRTSKPFHEIITFILNPYIYKEWDLGVITAFLIVLVIFTLPIIYKKLGFGYFAFSLASLLLPISSGLSSLPRYILSIVPVFIALGYILNKHNIIKYLLLYVLIFLQAIYVMGFVNNYFFVA